MDLKQKMQDLDARIAARRDAIDRRLGLDSPAPAATAPAPDVPAPPTSDSAPAPDDSVPAADIPAPAANDSAPEPKAASGRKAADSAGKKDGDASGKLSKVLDDLDAGLDFFGLFTIPGIIVKIVFILLCLGAFFSLLWTVRCLLAGWGWGISWWLGDAAVDAFLAWGLWWLCTHQKK